MASGKKRITAEKAISERPDGLQEIDLPSGYGSVQVKSLTKRTMNGLRDADGVIVDGEIQLGRFEPEVFREGLVDPKLNAEQVEKVFDEWPAGDVDAVLEAILDSSGLGADFREAREARDGAK